MFRIGRKHASHGYPRPGVASGAAFANRFVANPTVVPDPFTSATLFPIAAVNVVRRASGRFQLDVTVPVTFGGADGSVGFIAHAAAGTTTGGLVSGDGWRIAAAPGAALVVPVPTIVFTSSGFNVAADNLNLTVVLTGVNFDPLPAGPSTVFIQAATAGPTLATPAAFFASLYELP